MRTIDDLKVKLEKEASKPIEALIEALVNAENFNQEFFRADAGTRYILNTVLRPLQDYWTTGQILEYRNGKDPKAYFMTRIHSKMLNKEMVLIFSSQKKFFSSHVFTYEGYRTTFQYGLSEPYSSKNDNLISDLSIFFHKDISNSYRNLKERYRVSTEDGVLKTVPRPRVESQEDKTSKEKDNVEKEKSNVLFFDESHSAFSKKNSELPRSYNRADVVTVKIPIIETEW